MRISDVDSSRKNNMDMIRFIAASAVIYSHAFNLQNQRDPLEAVTGKATGAIAVAIFFALSGFLIAKSLTSRPSLHEFVLARVLRILPALIVVNVMVVVVAGLFWTALDPVQYFTDTSTWTYVFWNSTLLKCQFELPGVFESNVFGPAVNGSLWTLPVEARMYGLVFMAGVTAMLFDAVLGWGGRTRTRLVGIFGSVAVFLSVGGWKLLGVPYVSGVLSESGVRLMGYFGMGMVAHSLRSRIRLEGRFVLLGFGLLFFLRDSMVYDGIFVIWLAYACLWLSYTPALNAHSFGSRGDFSYGIYIFAYPVQQFFYARHPMMSPLTNAGVTFVTVLPLAVASFWLIERPALRLKRSASERLGTWIAVVRRRSLKAGI